MTEKQMDITTTHNKILFCDNTLWGLVNFRGCVIRHFVQKGYDVTLVAPEKEDKYMRTGVPDGVKYIPVKMGRTVSNPLNDIKYFLRLLKIIRREKPDYVFNYTIKPNIYGSIVAKLCGCHTTAMMAGLGFAFSSNSLQARVARMLYRVGLFFTDHLLLLNESNYETVLKKKLCKRSKMILLNGGEGVDLDRFAFKDNESDNVTFLFIGRVLWDKGYNEFTKAAEMVKKEHPNVKFKILGTLDPSYPLSVPSERVKEDEKKGTIEYLSFTNDMAAVYNEKGLVITLPSYGEGMNRTLMEACASGKPIITTDIAGCRETVDNGKNGFLVPVKDANALATAMIKYINLSSDKKRKFSVRSRVIAESRFNIRNVIKAYDNIVGTNNPKKQQ